MAEENLRRPYLKGGQRFIRLAQEVLPYTGFGVGGHRERAAEALGKIKYLSKSPRRVESIGWVLQDDEQFNNDPSLNGFVAQIAYSLIRVGEVVASGFPISQQDMDDMADAISVVEGIKARHTPGED